MTSGSTGLVTFPALYGSQMSISFLRFPPLIAALSWMNLVHIVPLGFNNLHFNIISHLSSMRTLPFRFSGQYFDRFMYFILWSYSSPMAHQSAYVSVLQIWPKKRLNVDVLPFVMT
jgi:hypothetical protein